jgi:hypothetical protein
VYFPDPNHSRGALVGERTLPDGLDSPGLILFKELKDEIEHTYPLQTASKWSKP